MSITKLFKIWFLCLILVLASSRPGQAETASYQDLIQSLLTPLPQTPAQPRLAVVDLVDIEGKTSRLGGQLTEELLPVLIASKRFTLLERSLIQQVIKEQAFSQSALADPRQLIELGKLSGAEYLLTGRYSPQPDQIRLNLHLIKAETGEIVAVAQTDLPKTDAMRQLLGEKTTGEFVQETGVELLKTLIQGMTRQAGPAETAPPQVLKPLFYEDFSAYPPGTPMPAYGPEMLVRASQRYPMHVLTSEHPAATQMALPLACPDNFVLEIHAIDILKDPNQISTTALDLVLTDAHGHRLSVSKRLHGFGLNGGPLQIAPWRYLEWNILGLVKQGDRIRYYLNGQLVNETLTTGYVGFTSLRVLSPQLRNWAFTRLALYPLPR